MKRILASLVFVTIWLPPVASAAEKPWHKIWRVSQAMLVASNAADIASSWGKSEANPMIRTSQSFSYGSMGIKLGLVAGSLAAQHYLVRTHPDRIPYVVVANFGTAAVMSVTAAHNMHVAPVQ